MQPPTSSSPTSQRPPKTNFAHGAVNDADSKVFCSSLCASGSAPQPGTSGISISDGPESRMGGWDKSLRVGVTLRVGVRLVIVTVYAIS